MSAGPDLLQLVEAVVRSDPNPPGFVGRLALGLGEGEDARWLLLHFEPGAVTTERDAGGLSAERYDCAWLVAAPSEARLPRPDDPAVRRGDAELLRRFSNRYLRTRSPLGLRVANRTQRKKERKA